jgi:RNA polymerase sigma-70 factor (ECF subfamily)
MKNERQDGLDHLIFSLGAVIQGRSRIVMCGMHLAAPPFSIPFICLFQAWPQSRQEQARATRQAAPMTSDREQPTGAMDWSSRISRVAAQQDRTAFSELFEYFAPRIKAFMLRSGASETNAEELAQETMLTVWRKASLFDPSSSGAAAWIFTIARNLRIDAHRRKQRGEAGERPDVDLEFEMDHAPLPDSKLETIQTEERVRAALSQLPDDQIRVVELSFFEEKAHAEIAQMLDIPLGTVKSRLRLAMVRLRNLLSELS